MYKIGDMVKIVGADSAYWGERQGWIGKMCIVDDIDGIKGVCVRSADSIIMGNWLLHTSVKPYFKENEQMLLFDLV